VLSEEPRVLSTLNRWFDDLFERRSAVFTPERLREMEVRWRSAAAARARNRLRIRRRLPAPAAVLPTPAEPEDIDTLEDVFATIQLPIGLLNMDYAGNNIRNIDKAREVIANANRASGKQQSELKLLGFMREGRLSELGRRAALARTNEQFARLWCRWLRQTPDAELEAINSRLLVAKRVFPQFWRLQQDVRNYFLRNADEAPNRGDLRTLLQTIELLCNARDVVHELTLDEMQTLSRLLQQRNRLPPFIRPEIESYFDNKGTRGWNTDDRRVVPNAWREAAR